MPLSRRFFLLSLIMLSASVLLAPVSAAERRRPRVVPHVDLERYAGTWYEIARMPNRFQKDCACCATATYTLREDGKIEILNECLKENGDLKSAEAEATAGGRSKARWRATFFKLLGVGVGKGRIWILGLDEDYRWAVVGDPDRKYGWILSRTPTLDAETRVAIDALITDRGYDPADFVDTLQQEEHR